ncbi:MAG: uroporphyrinogen decarboxylase [Bacteroidota bacterium]
MKLQNEQAPTKHLFLQACFRKPVPRTPLWIMRQAGRYLPEYRAIRAKVDFLTLCKTPQLAAEVTIQPVDIIGVDAAIIFSDILVVPEAMGMELIVEEGKGGPRFPYPIRNEGDIKKLTSPDPNRDLRFVMDALSLTRKNLENRVPLIGFSGSPWTLATYMVEGKGSKNFRYIKEMIYNAPATAHLLLDKLAKSVAEYLNAQIKAGAQAIQIFDTWGGILTQEAFAEFSLRYIEKVISEIQTSSIPIIVFCKDCGHSLNKISDSGCNVVGLDWTIDLAEARRQIGDKTALQGNLDPTILYAHPDRIRSEVKSILAKYGKGSGHIFNLGHGILPDIPVDNVKELVKAVREESIQYHK